MTGLMELASGWWVAVGAYVHPEDGPCVSLVQYDPRSELLRHGIKAVVMSEAEAQELSELLGQALATLRQAPQG